MATVSKINKVAGKAYQKWLNTKLPAGYPQLVEDGICGKLTTAATYVVFCNKNAKAATAEDLAKAAASLGETNTTRIRAVAQVEAPDSGWDNAGFPKILYERHYFWNLTNGVHGTTPFSNKSRSSKYTIDADKNGINDSWEMVTAAAQFDARAAFQSFSMSRFQIMGKWYSKLGYSEPWEMAYDVSRDEAVHYELLVKWIKLNGKVNAFKAISASSEACRPFALFWNGSQYASHNYHGRTAVAYKTLSAKYGA